MEPIVRIEVATDVIAKFPRIRLGLVRGSVETAAQPPSSLIHEMRANALRELSAAGTTSANLDGHPHVTGWRETYREFGVNPKKFRPTHEAFARRILRDAVWPEINPIVDIYLTNQLEYLLPHGGYDLAAVAGTIRLTLSPGGELFRPLGGGEETTDAGEVVYRDDNSVLTRRWNFRDADATKIDTQTRRFLLMIEAADPEIPDAAVERAATSLANRYRAAWQGTVEARMVIVDGEPIEL
jgi:DNA/RNA-binding domain of Phe-tRNA-synthetase-like protein